MVEASSNQILLIHEAQQGCRDATYEPSRFPVAVPYPSPHRATPAYVVVTSSDLDTSRNKASVSGLSWISRNQIDESALTKGQRRKLCALRKSVGDAIGEQAFAAWLSSQATAASAATEENATMIVDTLWPLVQQGKLAIPRGGFLLRRGRGRISVERAKP